MLKILVAVKHQECPPFRPSWTYGRRLVYPRKQRSSGESRNVPRITQPELERRSQEFQARFCPLHKAKELGPEREVH